MNDVRIDRDLERKILPMVAPTVERVADRVTDVAQQLSPSTKVWKTRKDGLVRPEHRVLEGDEVPEGFRFTLDSYDWDIENRGVGENTYMQGPRDESSRSVVHVKNCRCYLQDADGVADGISRGPLRFTREKISVAVASKSPWALDVEYGTNYPGIGAAPGWFPMTRAAQYVQTAVR